jgi:hypothetical protein
VIVLRSLWKVLLWSGLALLAVWVLFGRTQMRRIARDNEHLAQQLGPTKLRDGDLIFQTSTSPQSQAIQLATHSPYSHCGILYKQVGQWLVLEATSPVVKMTPLRNWVGRGQGEHFAIKRLRDADTALTPAALQRMEEAGKPLLKRRYDAQFDWSDDRMYCSELIWKVYERGLHRRLGTLQKLGDFDLSQPAVQTKLKERYGDQLPLNEPVISPVSIFNSPELVTVLSR